MSARKRRHVAVVVCSPVPNAIPAGMKMPAGFRLALRHWRQDGLSEKILSLSRMDRGPRGRAGSPVQTCSASFVTRPPKRFTSSFPVRSSQYASILRAWEFGHVIKAIFSGPRKRKRSTHASSHLVELSRVHRWTRKFVTPPCARPGFPERFEHEGARGRGGIGRFISCGVRIYSNPVGLYAAQEISCATAKKCETCGPGLRESAALWNARN